MKIYSPSGSDLDHLGSSWLQATIWDCFHPMSRKYLALSASVLGPLGVKTFQQFPDLIALLSVSKKKYFVGGPEEASSIHVIDHVS